MSDNQFDLMVIGTGPAGLTAAIYAKRQGLDVVVFGDTPGGNLVMIENIGNYPGFVGGISGAQLGTTFFAQAQSEGAVFTMMRLDKLEQQEHTFVGTTQAAEQYFAPAAIVACGVSPKRIEVPNADKKGIHYCSLCDGPLFRNRDATLAVLGGGNMAAHEALSLANFAKRVVIIHRGPKLRAEAALAQAMQAKGNIEIIVDAQVDAFHAGDQIDAVEITLHGREKTEVAVDGVFLAVGWGADLGVLQLPLATTREGFIKTDHKLQTSVPGLFAAGDVRDTDLRQIVTACADGARAATYAYEFITEQSRS